MTVHDSIDPINIIQKIYSDLNHPAPSNTKTFIVVQKLERFYNEINSTNPEIAKNILPYINSCRQTLEDESRLPGQREEAIKSSIRDILKMLSNSNVHGSNTSRLENQTPSQTLTDANRDIDLLKKVLADTRSLYDNVKTQLRSAQAQNAELSDKLTAQLERQQEELLTLRKYKEDYEWKLQEVEELQKQIIIQNNTLNYDLLVCDLKSVETPDTLCQELETRIAAGKISPTLRMFAENLMVVAKRREEIDWLVSEEGWPRMDRYIYHSPLLLPSDPGEAVEAETTLENLLLVSQLQIYLRDALGKVGLSSINPHEGDRFDSQACYAAEEDIKPATDPALDDTVASVIKLGYRYGDRVLRRAHVTRRRYNLAAAMLHTAPPPVPAIPETAVVSVPYPNENINHSTFAALEKSQDMGKELAADYPVALSSVTDIPKKTRTSRPREDDSDLLDAVN